MLWTSTVRTSTDLCVNRLATEGIYVCVIAEQFKVVFGARAIGNYWERSIRMMELLNCIELMMALILPHC